MAITSAQYTITTSPTQVVPTDLAAEMVYLHVAQGTCFIGDSTVTSTTGYQMDNGDKISLSNHEGSLYVCTSTGTGTLSVLVITK